MYQPSFNIGIEEEYQFIDPQSRELLGYATLSMSREKITVRERTPDTEFATKMSDFGVEAGTPVASDIHEAREQLLRLRTSMLEFARQNGCRLAASGTHAFSHWEGRGDVLPGYRAQVEDAQMVARRLLGFGLRVHIGVEDRELAIDVMNTMRYVLPHILCLSASSPFWSGKNTGLKSYRAVLMDALPRTGIPAYFASYPEYQAYVETLIRTNCIPDARQIRYDIIPHYRFPTLVIRICDVMPRLMDTLAVTALIQAAVAWMVDLRMKNLQFRMYERILIAENKWRAVRYGLDGKLIDFGIEQSLPARELVNELIDRTEPMAKKLNSLDYLQHCRSMIERGSSADLQVKAWNEAGQDAKAVVDYIVGESEKI